MCDKKIAFAVCGVGAIGSAHANALYGGKIDGAYLAALCDTDPEKLALCAEKFPEVPRFASHEELIDSGVCEALMIAVPHYSHVPIAEYALKKGVHVLSEKPVAVEASEARRAVAFAKEKGLLYGVMFNQRTTPVYIKAREIVKNGVIGELRRTLFVASAWYRTQHYYDNGGWRATWKGEGGGVLLNQAPHQLDLLQWLVGMPATVYGDCGISLWHDIEVEDDAVIVGRYENGASCVFISSTGELPGTNRLEITGSRGKLVAEGGKLKLFVNSFDEMDVRNTAIKSSYRADGKWEDITPEKLERDGHEIVLENFAHVLLGKEEELICPADEAINALDLSNAAYLSAYEGHPVPVPCNGEHFKKMLCEYKEKGKGVRLGNVEYHAEYSSRWKP